MKYCYLFKDYCTGDEYLFKSYRDAYEFTLEIALSVPNMPSTPGIDYDIIEMKITTPKEAIKDYYSEKW